MLQPRIVLIGAVKRTHGNQMHNVPTNLSLGINLFDAAIDEPIHFLLTVEPEIVPGDDLRVFNQQAPEGNKAAVLLTRLAGRLICPPVERHESFASSFDVDALLSSLCEAIPAETAD